MSTARKFWLSVIILTILLLVGWSLFLFSDVVGKGGYGLLGWVYVFFALHGVLAILLNIVVAASLLPRFSTVLPVKKWTYILLGSAGYYAFLVACYVIISDMRIF